MADTVLGSGDSVVNNTHIVPVFLESHTEVLVMETDIKLIVRQIIIYNYYLIYI